MTLRERVYRILLRGYPREFRDVHAESMVTTLLEGASIRGAFGEVREVAALVTGGLSARGDRARGTARGGLRHGVAMLLAPLAALNLAVVIAGFWTVQHPPGLGVAHGVGMWWVMATVAAVGLTLAVAGQRRGAAIVAAVVGLVPLGYDEWLQAAGRGDGDHLSIAAQRGFDGPMMSPFWLFPAVVILAAAIAGFPAKGRGRASHRLAALVGGAVLVAATIPSSLYLLLAIALVAAVACSVLGAWDRRLHGVALATWAIALPYVFWWWATGYPAHPGWPLLYLTVLPMMVTIAWVARRRGHALA